MHPVHLPASRYHCRLARGLGGDRYLIVADLYRETPHVKCRPVRTKGVRRKALVSHIRVPEIEYLTVNLTFELLVQPLQSLLE